MPIGNLRQGGLDFPSLQSAGLATRRRTPTAGSSYAGAIQP